MSKHLAVVFVSMLLAWELTGDALAQRAREGGGFHARGGFNGDVNRAHRSNVREHSFRNGNPPHRPGLGRVFDYGFDHGRVRYDNYMGHGDDCVLESRYVWNGWGTMRDLITVCY
jgi:hypothetical protein